MPEARRSRTGSRTPRSSGSTAGATEFGKRNANGLGQKINLARRRALVPTPGVGGAEYVGALGSSPSPPPVNFPCRAGTDLMLQSGSQVTEGIHFRNYRRSTMNAACPSCRSEDQPGDDPSPTQGVCSRHQEQRLEFLPSVSFPEVEFLMVVHPRETELYQYLQRALGDVRGVKVIMERRKVDRRREPRPFAGDRRSAPRRIRQGKVLLLGYTLVRFRRKALDRERAS